MKASMPFLRTLLKRISVYSVILICLSLSACKEAAPPVQDNFEFAKLHKNDLQLSVYMTAHTIERLLSVEEGRREAVSLMRANGITKVYIEVYRGGLVVSTKLLTLVKNYFIQNGFEVVGGIATVPGKDFGLRQEGPLGWFNWQNPKTQNDLKQVMIEVAPLFDTFIIDDFLCTGDTSLESKSAKGEREWSVYRRELMNSLAKSIFIDPARSVNPDINMIIKYPQWYDRFHMHGYDVETGHKSFDRVWVGTESRGQYTQRFGFVQPYEGFVNYRWMASNAGDKIGAAWFDHGDCDKQDFIEQAFQSVLAGAPELVIFNYGSFVNGHPGHHLLRMEFEKLAALAKTVATSPVHGVTAYKPPHSDAGGDLYIMDFIGMFGIPLIPVSSYPEQSETIFLPTQAAFDTKIVAKIEASLKHGARIIMTAGFLANVQGGEKLTAKAGITKIVINPESAEEIVVDGNIDVLNRPLDTEANFDLLDASIILEARAKGAKIPFLTKSADGQIFVLNSHTFSQADFDAVGEVLLCPRQLGLLELPKAWANSIRGAFNENLNIELDAPTRVTMQTLQNGDIVIHNYNKTEESIKLSGKDFTGFIDGFDSQSFNLEPNSIAIKMKPRSKLWLRKK